MRQSTTVVIVASIMTLVGSCAPAPDRSQTTSADSAAIPKTFDEYAAAWKASDAARIGKLYADDAIILPGDHPAETGVGAIVKYNQEFFDQYNPTAFDITQLETQI